MIARNRMLVALCLALAPALLSPRAESSDEKLTGDYLDAMRSAFEELYNLDYEEAKDSFEQLRSDYPEHPGPPLDLAIVVWQRELFRRNDLQLDRFASPSHFTESKGEKMPPSDQQAFERHLESSKRLSQAILDARPGDPDGLYYLGSALGVEASFAFTIEGDTLKALGLGRDARDRHRRLVEIDPGYVDAYLTLGMYHYLVDNLPWYVKWLASLIGYRGDEERGLEYLKSVAEGGRRSRDVARLLRMVLLVREERFGKALAVARGLKDSFPRNYLFALNEIQILEEMGRDEDTIEACLAVLRKVEAREPNYQLAPRPELRLRLAEKLFEKSRLELAEAAFRKALEDSEATEVEKARSHLHLGRIHARGGRPAEARRHFQRVLDLADSGKIRDEARRRLEDVS